MRNYQKLTTQKVTSELRKAGLVSAKRTRREKRSGYKVTKINSHAVAVSYSDHESKGIDHTEESNKMEKILANAGMAVRRPYGDKTILGIARKI